jgi:hypothetical protein
MRSQQLHGYFQAAPEGHHLDHKIIIGVLRSKQHRTHKILFSFSSSRVSSVTNFSLPPGAERSRWRESENQTMLLAAFSSKTPRAHKKAPARTFEV